MKLFAFLLFSLFCLIGFSQIHFYKQFSNNGYDYGEGIVQLPDSSYLITGSSSSFGEGPSQAFLLKIDSLGSFKWSRSFGGSESDGGRRVMYIENEGIYIAGFTNSIGAGAYDFYLLKSDLTGNVVWEKSYGTAAWERVYDAALTRDSGFILVGETTNTADGMSDMYIVRTDKNGNELWSQQVGGVGTDILRSIDQIDDSTFAIGGTVYVEDSLVNKAYLARIQDDGTFIWEKEIGPLGYNELFELTIADNRINGVGKSIATTGDTATITIRYDFSGLEIGYIQDGTAGTDFGVGICKIGTSDKYCVAVNTDNQFTFGGFDLNFYKHFSGLYYESQLCGVNFIKDEFLGEVIATSDHGAIGVGRLTESAQGGGAIFVIKMMSDGTFFNSNDTQIYTPLVSIDKLENESSVWRVFPNPTTGELNISSENLKQGTLLRLIDVSGRIVFESEVMNDLKTMIDITSFQKGLYQLVINNEALHIVRSVLLN